MIKIAKPKFLAKLLYDKEPHNPRLDSGNSQMVCWSDKYNLGDKHTYGSEKELLMQLMEKCGLKADELNIDMDDFENQREKLFDTLRKQMLILPLYLYDGKFPEISFTKDSLGKQGEFVGYLFVDPELTEELYASGSLEDKQNALLGLFDEIDLYSHYMSGNNFLLQIYRDDGSLYFENQYTGNLNDEMIDEMKLSAQNALEGEKVTSQEVDDMFGVDAPQIISDKEYEAVPQVENVEYEEMEM